jgi:hypothetical protein
MRKPVNFCTSASVVALLSAVVVRAIPSFNAMRRAVTSVETDKKLSVVSARCTGGGNEWIAVGKFVAEICPARAERHVAYRARGGTVGEQPGDEATTSTEGSALNQIQFNW